MKKLIINHFVHNPNFSNGVTNYIRELNKLLGDDNSYTEFNKPYNMSMKDFRGYLARSVRDDVENYSIIECAESQSPCLYLPNSFKVHVRMHCPFYLLKKVTNEVYDEDRFSDEVRAMLKAKAVSSPSHGMLEYLKDELPIEKIHVYKNPIVNNLSYFIEDAQKDIDVIFLSRFNKLKGNEYIETLIQSLPKNLNIYIIGKQELKINLTQEYENVTFIDHVEGNDKYKYLSRSKVAISMSKFENCSMAILEALSVGTPVVAWDVGGNAEIAPPSVLRVAQLGNVGEFAEYIMSFIQSKKLTEIDFLTVIDALNNDFIQGINHVEKYVNGELIDIYKGLSYAPLHESLVKNCSDYIEEKIDNVSPINIGVITNSNDMAQFFYKNYNSFQNFINCRIFSCNNIKGVNVTLLTNSLIDIDTLAQKVKNTKIQLLIIDRYFPILENELNKLRSIIKIPILLAYSSPISNGKYFIDTGHRADKSSIWDMKIKCLSNMQCVSKSKLLIWAHQITELSIIDNLNLEKYITSLGFVSVTFVGNDEVLNNIIHDGLDIEYLAPEQVCYSEYSHIISFSDVCLDLFFEFENMIFILNSDSLYKNKNIGANLQDLYTDMGSRRYVLSLLKSKDYSYALDIAYSDIFKVLSLEQYND